MYSKEYFTLLDISTIESCEDLSYFIYPFVKYYQAVVHSGNVQQIQKLERLAEESIKYFKNRFGDEYTAQIQTKYESYFPLRDSDDSLTNEKYEIFVKVFMEEK